MGVERGVATRLAQMVWPMMTVSVTNLEGSNFEIFAKCDENVQLPQFFGNKGLYYILYRRKGHVTPIVTVQSSKILSVTKKIATEPQFARACQ